MFTGHDEINITHDKLTLDFFDVSYVTLFIIWRRVFYWELNHS